MSLVFLFRKGPKWAQIKKKPNIFLIELIGGKI